MTLATFKNSLRENELPENLSIHLKALWYDAKGDWNKAHGLIDSLQDPDSAFLHAYLHRKEGDISNADYWYRRAGRQRPSISLKEEWEDMVNYFLPLS